ncbi:MAG: hypothetical protein LBD67_04665 [Candidatus Accumulibacter sp.]|nr:hypothetical protein [Accumulibacter sp.]
MRTLVGHWRGLSCDEWMKLDFEFGSLTCIDVQGVFDSNSDM